jgi:ABC-type transporter Mla subunit MlaD
LDQQKQQLENTVSHISDTTNQVTNSVNEYQQTNREILDKSIDTTNKYQQETINLIHSIINNTIGLQGILLILFNQSFQNL